MDTFSPGRDSYRAGPPEDESDSERRTVIVELRTVEPLVRRLSHGVFNDNAGPGSARRRVIDILSGFRADAPLPPIQLDRLPPGSPYQFRIYNGAHRFYCSMAVGFTRIPAVVYEFEEWIRRAGG